MTPDSNSEWQLVELGSVSPEQWGPMAIAAEPRQVGYPRWAPFHGWRVVAYSGKDGGMYLLDGGVALEEGLEGGKLGNVAHLMGHSSQSTTSDHVDSN